MSDSYCWSGGEEHILRFGLNHANQVIIFEPLFEEKNRTRRMIVEMMRALDGLGIGSALPDLPGTGESLIEYADIEMDDWRHGVISVVETIKPGLIASFRGGALLDGIAVAKGYWRFMPETGARLIRDLERTRVAGGQDGLLGGNRLSEGFVAELKAATPANVRPLRTVRLEGDAGEADYKVDGAPLWRRAEPDEAPSLSRRLAEDIANWARLCAAS